MGLGPSVITMSVWVSQQHSWFIAIPLSTYFDAYCRYQMRHLHSQLEAIYILNTWKYMKIDINIHVKIKDYSKTFIFMEHWPGLTGLTAISIPKVLLVLGQNMIPLSDKHRTFLCKLSQFSKPESLQPQQQSWFCKDPITTLMLSRALVDSGTASAYPHPFTAPIIPTLYALNRLCYNNPFDPL